MISPATDSSVSGQEKAAQINNDHEEETSKRIHQKKQSSDQSGVIIGSDTKEINEYSNISEDQKSD